VSTRFEVGRWVGL